VPQLEKLLQTRGSLADFNVRSLLEAAQTERATGTLTLRQNGQGFTTLYFLFGHLFHAVGEGTTGDEAVISALGWSSGEFDFDAKAKLPADETVRSSIPELIERAHQNGRVAPAPAPAKPGRRVAAQPEAEPWTPPPAASPRPQSTPAGWSRFFKQRPRPRHGREPVPVPAGQTMYDSLKTSFVDFPRLITTLEREGHTGYVRLLTETANGLIYFREGTVLECVYDAGDNPSPELGKAALTHFNEEVNRGQGVLDVVGLTPELVDGLYELTVAQPVYTELYASWVNVSALLGFLEERQLNGTITVRAATGTGVIILKDGKLAGAYTSESREVSERADAVLALCRDPGAMIEVKTHAEGRHEPLDLSDVIGGRRGFTAPTPAPAPAPPRPAATFQPQPPATPVYSPPEPPAQPAPTPVPAYAPAPETSGQDWETVVADLQQMTEDQLGNRARKVKDLLGAAERSRAGILSAIDQIPSISILFVDASRLEALANDLKARLDAYPIA
jgi:hypothetical protein